LQVLAAEYLHQQQLITLWWQAPAAVLTVAGTLTLAVAVRAVCELTQVLR
jgi:hypothetical protein